MNKKIDSMFGVVKIHVSKDNMIDVARCPVCRQTNIFWNIGELIPRHEYRGNLCRGVGQKPIKDRTTFHIKKK